MSDKDTVVETEVEVEAPEVIVDPAETSAREAGWVSKEEWVAQGRDPEDHRSAKEFERVGELYKSLHQVKREQKQTQAALTALQRHHQFVFEKAHKKALDDLKYSRRVAMREGDEALLESVENQMEDLNQEFTTQKQAMLAAQQAQQPVSYPEFDAFVERNPWYLTDSDLKDEADAIGFVYLNKPGSNKDPKVAFDHVEKKMRQKFPEKFGIKRGAPNPTAAPDRTARVSRNDIQLDEFETKIMRDLVQAGTMTEAEYKAELKKAKGIK